ncbi:MAG TPA: SPOR domain-containing protein [Bacteroidia bacterium]|nr:SPOR domain-containing protein [Bacteroidia bacterium]
MAIPLMGQKETESVEKYRVVYEFTSPQYEIVGDGTTNAQAHTSVSPDSMGVYYYFDDALPRLIDLHKRGNESTTEGPGFRIQIYAGSKMETANEAKTDFLQTFRTANMEVYKDWNPPHFWVRVGDFLSRNEAMKQLSHVRQVFPDAFVVQDKIKLPKYKKLSPHD